jgi:DNA modification methylase
VFDAESKVLYLQYPPGGVHPCPTPKGISDFVLGRFYKSGMLVLDPFAGTAQLGAEVLVRGGQFIGYEIDAEMSRLAELNLASA